jgi:hypothetical protein
MGWMYVSSTGDREVVDAKTRLYIAQEGREFLLDTVVGQSRVVASWRLSGRGIIPLHTARGLGPFIEVVRCARFQRTAQTGLQVIERFSWRPRSCSRMFSSEFARLMGEPHDRSNVAWNGSCFEG